MRSKKVLFGVDYLHGELTQYYTVDSPERQLLLAVLLNAMAEATKWGYDANRIGASKAKKHQISKDAWHWLTDTNTDRPWSVRWVLNHITPNPDGWLKLIHHRVERDMVNLSISRYSKFRNRRRARRLRVA